VAVVRERGTTFRSSLAVKERALDLAICGTIGAAFGTIVSSIVDDVFMPLAGRIIGGVNFSNSSDVLSNPPHEPVPSLAVA
jgi:large conductance mechanosensitive channel